MTKLVSLNANGNAICTSLMVAEKFGKEHKNVLRDIRELLNTAPESLDRLNFEPISLNDSYGRPQPAYEMTRDGFTLLAMGFTGEEALKWKIEFINAFNAMEAELLKQNKKPQTLMPTALETFDMMSRVLATCYEGNQLTLAMDKCCKHLSGQSALEVTNTELIAPQQQQLYTPSELGRQLEPPLSPIKVNKLLATMGWQIKVEKKWEAIGDGVKYAVYLDTGKAHSDGTPIRQLKWTTDTIFALQGELNSDE